MSTKSRAYLDLGVGQNLSGRVVFEFFNDASEMLVDNFKSLCLGDRSTSVRGRPRKISFEDCSVFRVVKGEYLQTGDFTNNDGTGGASVYGDYIKDRPTSRLHSQAGLVTMVNMRNSDSPDAPELTTNVYGSQFCILFGKVSKFDRSNIVIGRVVEGMEFVRAIENVPVDSKFRPKVEVGILSCGVFKVTVQTYNEMSKQKELLESLMNTLEEKEEPELEEDTGIRCVYTGRINKKRLPNESSATTLGKKLLTESLQGIKHHYVPETFTESVPLEDVVVSKEDELAQDQLKQPLESESILKEQHLDRELPEKEDLYDGELEEKEEQEEDTVREQLQEPGEPEPESEEEEEDGDHDEISLRLKKLKEKMNECSRLNTSEIILEQKVKSNPKSELHIYKSYTNKSDKKEDADKEISSKLTKELNMTANTVERINKVERIKNKNKTFGWNVFNQDALYRAHKKRVRETGFNPDQYERQKEELGDNFYRPGVVNYVPSETAKDIVVKNVEKQYKKRDQFSRRRLYDDEAQDISYINERNRVFNKKLERSFGAYSKEIKQNLERGTAL